MFLLAVFDIFIIIVLGYSIIRGLFSYFSTIYVHSYLWSLQLETALALFIAAVLKDTQLFVVLLQKIVGNLFYPQWQNSENGNEFFEDMMESFVIASAGNILHYYYLIYAVN